MRFIDIFCILLICTVKLFGAQSYDAFHVEHSFICTNSSSAVYIPTGHSNLRWLTLLSPCYPNEDYKGCTNQEICYIVLQDVPDHVWIGVFVEEESDTTDIFHLRSNTSTLYKSPINNLQLGLVYSDSQPLSNNMLAAALQHDGITSTDLSHYRFRIAIKLAYVMGRSYEGVKSAAARSGGFIVSHDTFDDGRDSNNHYPEVVDEVLTLTGLSNKYTLRLTFLSFDLDLTYVSIYGSYDDYLEISDMRGYTTDVKYCGYDNLSGCYIDLYPVDDKITFTFKARELLGDSASAGFLLQYEVLQPQTECPPDIQNTKEPTEIAGSSQIYNRECETNYWIQKQVYNQTVYCNIEDWQSYILPCVEIECELPAISTDSELSFTLSSRGRATVGTNTSYSCNSKRYELTDGTEISTCTSNGEWSSPTPRCTLIDETTTGSIERTTANGLSPMAESTLIGIGVGGLAIVVVVVVLLLVRRGKCRTAGPAYSIPPGEVPLDEMDNVVTNSNASEIAHSSAPTYETAVRDADIHLYETTNQQHSTYENVGGNILSEPNPYEYTDIPDEPHLYDKVTKKK